MPPKPQKYDYTWLNAGWQYEQANGRATITPRNLNASHLMEYDPEWVRDMNRYRQWIKYQEDRAKLPKDLRK